MNTKRIIRKICKDFHKRFPEYSIVAYRIEQYYEGCSITNHFVTDAHLRDVDLDTPENKELADILHWWVDTLRYLVSNHGDEAWTFDDKDPNIMLHDLTYIYKKYE